MPEIESIQAGSDTFTNVADMDVTITAVDLDNSIALISNTAGHSANSQYDHQFLSAALTTTTNLRVSRSATHGSVLPIVEWRVIEFKSGELAQAVQTGDLDLTSATTNETLTATALDDSAIIVDNRTSTTSDLETPTAELTSTTNLQFVAPQGAPSTGEVEVAYQVIEFNAADVSVQRGTETITSGSASVNATLSAVTEAKTLVTGWSGGDTALTGVARNQIGARLTSTTNLLLDRGSTVSISPEVSVSWEAVEFSDDVDVQAGQESQSTTETDTSATITAVDADRGVLWGAIGWQQNVTQDGMTAPGYLVTQDLTSTTNIDFKRQVHQSKTNDIDWQVIEWAAAAGGGDPPPKGSLIMMGKGI